MKKTFYTVSLLSALAAVALSNCTGKQASAEEQAEAIKKPDYGGYATQAEYGEHLVTICGCNDCHTPKKMGAHGPEIDSALMLSGHPSQMPCPDVNKKDMEGKAVVCTNDLTAWVGPWGVSYTANLTPDPTGIGNWDETTFLTAIRMGKYKGIENGRDLLPPMPWDMYRHMSDNELKAVFAYLRTVKPIHNIVPAPEAPVLMAKK